MQLLPCVKVCLSLFVGKTDPGIIIYVLYAIVVVNEFVGATLLKILTLDINKMLSLAVT